MEVKAVWKAVCFLLIFFAVSCSQTQALDFKSGKENVTTTTPGLFACKKIFFNVPFSGGQQVRVFASVGHSVKSPTPRNGAAIWVEDVSARGFTVCVFEFGDGSNGTTEVNWIALQTPPRGSQLGTASLSAWASGTKCKKIYLQKRFMTPPSVFVTASHQSPNRPQDAVAVWVEDVNNYNFKICFRETKVFGGKHKNLKINWMAFNDLRLENFTLTNRIVFNSTSSGSHQENYAFCQTINFTNLLFAPPVVIVTPKYSYNNALLSLPRCSAITAWIEHSSTKDIKLCVKNSNAKSGDAITVDYLVIGEVDPCLGVVCPLHGLCKALGPHDTRCVCVDSCPSYLEPVCSSNGTTYDNECLFKQEMCRLRLNHTVRHPGSCEGFPFQQGRRHMPHIPLLGYSHCEVIRLNPSLFNPRKSIGVQITVNHIDTSDKSYVHDAAVSWVENVNYDRFTACVMAAGFNERNSSANVTVDWMAYQGAPVGAVAGKVPISQWWTGTTCKAVTFPSGKFLFKPSVLVTAEHQRSGLKRDAASLWIEDVTQSSFIICLRELQNYAGSHENISVNWLAFTHLHKSPFSEHNSTYFENNKPPLDDHNNAFCKDVNFANFYNATPNVFVTAEHSSKGENLSPAYNGITAWIECINKTTGFRVCFKELFVAKYDPLSIAYAVLPGKHADYFTNSNILAGNTFYQIRLQEFLKPAVGSHPQWVLCYRASTHGWAARTFHSRCDGKRDTVTIIKKGQYVFGGYTDVPWDSSWGYSSTRNAFIFSLRNREGLGPFKSRVTMPYYAIFRRGHYGPTFGGGHDIYIADYANTNTNSYTYFAYSYSAPSGVQNSRTILAGTYKFTPDELEVFYRR